MSCDHIRNEYDDSPCLHCLEREALRKGQLRDHLTIERLTGELTEVRQQRDAWKTRADDAESKLRPNYTVLSALADEAAAKMEADRLRREMATEGDAYRALITEHAALQAKYESAQKEIDRVLALTKGSDAELCQLNDNLQCEMDANSELRRKVQELESVLIDRNLAPQYDITPARETEERLLARIRALKAVAKAAAADAEAI